MRPPWSPEHSEPRWTWHWLQSFWPAPVTVSSRERLRVVLGAGPVNLAAAAVALTITVMFATRSLHPPGGATALLIVLSGAADPVIALAPVMLNSVLLCSVGLLWNNATGRQYPHRQIATDTGSAASTQVTESDLDAVLARYNQVLDVSRDDLQALLEQTQMRAYERRIADVRCGDIMSRQLTTVGINTPLQEAWALLRQRRIKALPVVDNAQHIVGIVTLADFLNAAGIDWQEGIADKLRAFIRTTPASDADKPQVVGQIMTRKVRVTSMRRHLADLIPLFGSTGHHHIPVVGDGGTLVGMITQSDLVAALTVKVET
ncbi:MAG: CBS domain-containing protein [Burkholderiales bacterium]|nr:CBS domain-containing protein [Burkholderiales bacterium]